MATQLSTTFVLRISKFFVSLLINGKDERNPLENMLTTIYIDSMSIRKTTFLYVLSFDVDNRDYASKCFMLYLLHIFAIDLFKSTCNHMYYIYLHHIALKFHILVLKEPFD